MPNYLPESLGACPSTPWSLIDRVRREGVEGARPYLADLLVRYQSALKAHLTRKVRLSPERAEDMLQGFIADKVLEHNLVSLADPNRGKFRTFVFTALDRYVTDEKRKRRAAKRQPEGGQLYSTDDEIASIISKDPSPDVFDVEWARRVLAETLRRMQTECTESAQDRAWGIFEHRVLKPLLDGAEALPYDQLVERFGFESPAQASNALTTAKRMFDRVLRSVIGEYADGNTDTEEEIRYLIEILSRSSAR